ncbi:MAG: glycosyltransferase involved in cell wall biosynthesis [Parasphingorhabdus sp.]|jgi:glycosyltransferase involved in cell wall biosynthesis
MGLKSLVFSTNYGYLPEVIGGLQTTIHELCLELKSRGIEPVINCGYASTRKSVSKTDRSDTHNGYLVVRTTNPEVSLASVASAACADAICVLTGRVTVPMIISALESGVPTSVYLHNVEYAQVGGVFVPDPALLYFSNSCFTRRRLRSMFGVDSTTLIPLVERERYQCSSSREKVLFINPTHLKGVEIMFQIAEKLPNITFQVAESWVVANTWREYCQSRAEELGNIEWISATRDMKLLYGNARLLLMPSIWEETFGRCVTEAQLNGIPVVGSSRGGLPEAIGDGGMILDADGEISNWVEAVDKLFNDQTLYSEKSAAAFAHSMRAEASPEYLVDLFIEKLENHIEQSHTSQDDIEN